VASVLECLPPDSRVAVIRIRSLGDCVLTTPALDILKRARPDLRLAIVVEDRFRQIFDRNPDLDQVLAPQLPALRAFRPQLTINLHGGTRSAWLTLASGARFRAGFAHFRHRALYNVRIPRAQEILGVDRTVHTAEHLASAMFYLGVPRCEIPRAKLIASPATPSATAVLHAVAAAPEKTWPAANFVRVARHLQESGLEPVFIGAAADDLSPFRPFRTLSGAPLSAIQQLLSSAALFVGNDSGPAHIAAAFGVPSIVLFGPSNPAIWSPWRTPSEVMAGADLARISVEQVLDALARLRVHA
jgi:ADP-heptose:LPS heptosyltransferase